MPYCDARGIANAFITLAEDEDRLLTPMQLQKLAFFAQGFSLAIRDGVELFEQNVEAWEWGPVVRDIYSGLRRYGADGVDGRIHEYEWRQYAMERGPVVRARMDNDDRSIVKGVYDTYGHLSGGELSELTHRIGTPWQKTYRAGVKGVVIPNSLMQEFFSERANRQV